mmetsp:Transcript_19323/g.29626  ORF Transcript_19323/g.29626 Transcript_19323/m.29626 type:complete len:221 (-) Transcript_19323:734-1396(-)
MILEQVLNLQEFGDVPDGRELRAELREHAQIGGEAEPAGVLYLGEQLLKGCVQLWALLQVVDIQDDTVRERRELENGGTLLFFKRVNRRLPFGVDTDDISFELLQEVEVFHLTDKVILVVGRKVDVLLGRSANGAKVRCYFRLRVIVDVINPVSSVRSQKVRVLKIGTSEVVPEPNALRLVRVLKHALAEVGDGPSVILEELFHPVDRPVVWIVSTLESS